MRDWWIRNSYSIETKVEMVTLFFPLSWKMPNCDIVVLLEAWKKGADVGVVLGPYHSKEAIDLTALSGLPVIVDNGAYTAWKGGEKPDWDKARSIAEELNANFIVALDTIDEPEESLKLSLETFKSTHIEKIVPFQAITKGIQNSEQIKKHLRIFLDNGVRVFGFPCVNSMRNGTLPFVLRCRWIVPARCHALGFPFGNRKWIKKLKYFETADATFYNMARSTEDRKKLHTTILKLYLEARLPDHKGPLMDFYLLLRKTPRSQQNDR